jgi:hypothetical protein
VADYKNNPSYFVSPHAKKYLVRVILDALIILATFLAGSVVLGFVSRLVWHLVSIGWNIADMVLR